MSVVLTTILWSVGVSTLVPSAVYAATGSEVACTNVEAGDMIKTAGGAAIYFVNADMTRSFFSNGDVFKSWNNDDKYASHYLLVTGDCMSSFKTAGAVLPRPGSYVVKEKGGSKSYAVLPGNVLAEISSTAVTALYGKRVMEVDPATWGYYFTNGATGAAITEAKAHEGMLVKNGTSYYVVGANKTLRKITAEGLTANRYRTAYAYTLTSTDGYTMGEDVTAEETTLSDRSQGLKGNGSTTGTTPVYGGNVGVSLSANTPESGNVVINIDNVVFGKFVFKAGSDKDIVVNAVKIGRKGLGSTGDFANITLYDGGTKLGNTKSSWNDDNTMTYNISGGWKIPAGTSKELTVTANIDTASTYNALGIVAVTGEGLDSTGLPVYANQMSGVNVTVGQATITNVGTNLTKKIGTNDVVMAQFKVALNDKENGKIEAVTLKNKAATNNAADGDVANLSLYQGSTKLAGPVKMVSDKITFNLETPYSIEKSKNQTFKVVGDIVNGAGNKVEFVLENTSDLKVMGSVYNTYMTVVNTNYNEAGEGETVTIDGAELNLSYTGSNLDIMADKTDVEFGTLTMSAGSTDIKISEMIFTVDETDGNSAATDNKDLDNLQLVDKVGGGSYSMSMTNGGDTNANDETWTMSDEIYLNAGETRTFIIRADVPAGVGNGDSYRVNMTVDTTNLKAETQPAGDTVSNFSIGSFTGKVITVKSPTLKVAGITQNTGTAVVNDENVVLFKGTMEASADDITVSQATFIANTVFATENWTEIGFYLVNADGTYTAEQTLTKSAMSSGTVDFDSLSFVVKNGATNKVTFVVKGKVASTLVSNNQNQNLALAYVDAKDASNNDATLSPTGLSTVGLNTSTDLTTGTREVNLSDKGKFYVQMVNNVTGYNKDRIVLAGTNLFVGKLKLRADDEAVKVKDLKLTNASSNNAVEEVCLYSAESTAADKLLACASVSSGVAFFDNIDKEVAQGTSYWYIYAKTKPMSNSSNGTSRPADQVKFLVDYAGDSTSLEVEGSRSGSIYTYAGADTTMAAGQFAFDYDNDDVYNESGDDKTATTKIFYMAGTKISNVDLVNSNGGKSVDTSLSGTDYYNVAIIAVTADASSNTDSDGNALKTIFASTTINIEKAASTTIDTATIERIGGTDGEKSLTVGTNLTSNVQTSGDLTGTLSSLMTNDQKIDPGTTAYYVVRVHVNAVSTATNYTNYVRANLNKLNGTSSVTAATDANINWKDGYNSTMFTALLLDTTSITGVKISKTNN